MHKFEVNFKFCYNIEEIEPNFKGEKTCSKDLFILTNLYNFKILIS